MGENRIKLRKSFCEFTNSLLQMDVVDGMRDTIMSFMEELRSAMGDTLPYPELKQAQADMIEMMWETSEALLSVEFWDDGEYDLSLYYKGRANVGSEIDLEGMQGVSPLVPYLREFKL